MTPYYEHAGITIYHGDCREIVPMLKDIDVVITDPPYPDYHAELYHYDPEAIKVLLQLQCRQFVFWSAKVGFPLDHSAVHIWDKEVPTTPYERIFERNGGTAYRVFRHQFVNNRVMARFHRDEWTKHPSQKPRKLMNELVLLASEPEQCILDAFCGSGSTLKAAKENGRRAIGIEIDERWCEYIAMRIAQDMLFIPEE